MNRRNFIQLSSLASASLLVPGFVSGFASDPVLRSPGRRLVVLQLSGGNDGLNTVIPVLNDIYYRQRPVLAIRASEGLPLNDETALHPALGGLRALYDAGQLCVLNGVGYEHPDRSHFRSMDIWQSGSRAGETLSTGWLGRYFDKYCVSCDTRNTFGVEVDGSLSLAMRGAGLKALALHDPSQFHTAAESGFLQPVSDAHTSGHRHALPDYLFRTLRDTELSADYINAHVKGATPTQSYPDTTLGNRLRMIASLILSGADTRVFYASHGSFDTHVGQRCRHEMLLREMDAALSAFAAEMRRAGLFDEVLVMIFSEFGRRVAENGSGGTDHGTAGPMFMISGALRKPGIYNPVPDLAALDEGDLRHSIDFRSVYATVLSRWLGSPHEPVLGAGLETLTFV